MSNVVDPYDAFTETKMLQIWNSKKKFIFFFAQFNGCLSFAALKNTNRKMSNSNAYYIVISSKSYCDAL